MISPGKKPAWAALAGTSSAATARTVIRRRGRRIAPNGSQPWAGAEVSWSRRTWSGRTRCRADAEALGGGLGAPALDLGVDPRVVPAALGAQRGGHPARRAVVELAGGQQAQPRAPQQDVADGQRPLAAGG